MSVLHLSVVLSLLGTLLSGCAVVSVGGAAVSVASTAVATTAKVGGAVVGGAVDMAIPDGDEDEN